MLQASCRTSGSLPSPGGRPDIEGDGTAYKTQRCGKAAVCTVGDRRATAEGAEVTGVLSG